MITTQNRTLGQREMLQERSAAPPFIADGQARCGKERVIVGQGGERSFAAFDISVQDRPDASFAVVEMNGYYRGARLSEKGRRIAEMLGHKHCVYERKDNHLAVVAAD